MTKDCKQCDENRHDEYGEPCMTCHTFREKQDALMIVERLDIEIEKRKHPTDKEGSSLILNTLLDGEDKV